MAHCHLILGGQRSGKSAYAEKLALQNAKSPAYVATAQPLDQDFQSRVEKHQATRDERFTTYEEPLKLVTILPDLCQKHDVVLVDCLTLWVTNLMFNGDAEGNAPVALATEQLLDALPHCSGRVMFVSNEVGLGGIAENAVSRRFADHCGTLHQHLAEICDRVDLVVAGIPMQVK